MPSHKILISKIKYKIKILNTKSEWTTQIHQVSPTRTQEQHRSKEPPHDQSSSKGSNWITLTRELTPLKLSLPTNF